MDAPMDWRLLAQGLQGMGVPVPTILEMVDQAKRAAQQASVPEQALQFFREGTTQRYFPIQPGYSAMMQPPGGGLPPSVSMPAALPPGGLASDVGFNAVESQAPSLLQRIQATPQLLRNYAGQLGAGAQLYGRQALPYLGAAAAAAPRLAAMAPGMVLRAVPGAMALGAGMALNEEAQDPTFTRGFQNFVDDAMLGWNPPVETLQGPASLVPRFVPIAAVRQASPVDARGTGAMDLVPEAAMEDDTLGVPPINLPVLSAFTPEMIDETRRVFALAARGSATNSRLPGQVVDPVGYAQGVRAYTEHLLRSGWSPRDVSDLYMRATGTRMAMPIATQQGLGLE